MGDVVLVGGPLDGERFDVQLQPSTAALVIPVEPEDLDLTRPYDLARYVRTDRVTAAGARIFEYESTTGGP